MLWGIDEEQIEIRISELEYRPAPQGFGNLSADLHFLAHESDNSMNGGKTPILDAVHRNL